MLSRFKRKPQPPRSDTTTALATPIEPAAMLWVLGSLCQLYRIPFDAKLVLQRYAPPYSLATVGEAAEALGLQVGEWRRAAGDPAQSLPMRLSH